MPEAAYPLATLLGRLLAWLRNTTSNDHDHATQ